MASIKLENFSLPKLKEFRKKIADAIAELTYRRRVEAVLALEECAKELGFSLVELKGVKKAHRASGHTAAKYRHPEVPSKTWSGRGRQPSWFKAAMSEGRSPESMSIEVDG
jgi:DNA-binding protein H-NS